MKSEKESQYTIQPKTQNQDKKQNKSRVKFKNTATLRYYDFPSPPNLISQDRNIGLSIPFEKFFSVFNENQNSRTISTDRTENNINIKKDSNIKDINRKRQNLIETSSERVENFMEKLKNGDKVLLKSILISCENNTKLDLEKKGARIFTKREFYKMFSSGHNEVGLTLLLNRKEINSLRSMSKKRVLELIKGSFMTGKEYLKKLNANKLKKHLANIFKKEMKVIEGNRLEMLIQELCAREVLVDTYEEPELKKKFEKILTMEEKDNKKYNSKMADNSFKNLEEAILKAGCRFLKRHVKTLLPKKFLKKINFNGDLNLTVRSLCFRIEFFLLVMENARNRFSEDFLKQSGLINFFDGVKFKRVIFHFENREFFDHVPFVKEDLKFIKNDAIIKILTNVGVPKESLFNEEERTLRVFLLSTLSAKLENYFSEILSEELSDFGGFNKDEDKIKVLFRKAEKFYISKFQK